MVATDRANMLAQGLSVTADAAGQAGSGMIVQPPFPRVVGLVQAGDAQWSA